MRGRDTELGQIRELLAAARRGGSGALVVTGEAGMGKTLLLSHAVAAATGFRVIRCAGVRAESDLAHAALQALLRPAVSLVDRLSAPQAAALRGAFGLAASLSPDRYLLGLATLSLLSELAADAPVLCVIDDAHWVDSASASALCFAARRLDADGVVMIFAARPGRFTAEGLAEARLGALDECSASALLADTGADLSPAARWRLLAEAGGNPLALVELSRAIAAGSTEPSLPARLRDAYASQIGALSGPAQQVMLIGAAEGTGDLRVVTRAAESAGLRADLPSALAEAEQSGLVTINGRFRFRHPLVRAAAYESAAREQRREAHRAIGGALTDAVDADRRAWHLAAAALGPDEDIAAELERTASRAARRSGHDAAGKALERAAELTAEPALRARRLLSAAEFAVLGGRPAVASELMRQAEGSLADRESALRAARVQGTVAHELGQTRTAHAILVAAADRTAAEDPGAAGTMLAETVIACRHDLELAGQAYRRLRALPGAEDLPPGKVAGRSPAVAAVQMQRGAYQWLLRGFDKAGAGAADRFRAAAAAHLAGDYETAAEHGQAALDLCQAEGLTGPLPFGFAIMSATLIRLNRFAAAAPMAAEGLGVAEVTGQAMQAATLEGMLAYLAAVSGDFEETRRLAARATQTFAGTDNPTGATWAEQALALADLVSGQPEAALARYEQSAAQEGYRAIGLIQGLADHVESAVRAGAADRAAEPFALLREWSETAVAAPWIAATLERCRGAIAAGNTASGNTASGDWTADRCFERAIAGYGAAGYVFDQARTQLLFGEWLRRSRRPGASRAILRGAQDGFERAGAVPWARRARAELRAAGARTAEPPEAAEELTERLTPQELAIVRLAASGATNREIAARIFVSPRTVSHHLYRAFPKLGVATRTELARLVLAQGGPPDEAPA